MATTVFLDTSIQIYRGLAEAKQLRQIESLLASATIDAVTSHYVWMEYQRTVISDYAHIHRLLMEYHGWNELLRHLFDGSRAFRLRSAVRCAKIVSKIIEQSYQDWRLARDMVDEQIASGLQEQFWTHVSPLPDTVHCDLVKLGSKREANHCYRVADTCRKEQATCSLPEFLRAHQPQLQAIVDHLRVHPRSIKDQPRVERLLTTVLQDARSALGQSACWPLGDIVILLQVPADAMVWSLDADFRVLTNMLGLKQYTAWIE